MGMKKEIYASCEQEGDIVINARLLAEILRKLKGIDVEIECDEGHRYETNLHRFYNGSRCPICKKSKGEVKISRLLEKYRIKYISQYKFDDCKFYRYLPFDFYLPDYNCCIEFDGKQHFQNTNTFYNYEETHNHDIIKNNWCKENNIPLIRIPYTHLKDLKIEDLLLETSKFIV